MVVQRDREQHVLWTAGLIAALLPLAAMLLFVAFSPATNWLVRTAVAAFCTLAVVRPDAALLVTIALPGFGIILSHLAGVTTLRVTELLVVASLAGCCVRALLDRVPFQRVVCGSIATPVILFAIVVVASTMVWQQIYPFWPGHPSAQTDLLLKFATRDYFVQPGRFWGLVSAAVVLEGLALYVVVTALCQADATFFDRALRMLAVGGSGLAVMSIVRLSEILLRNPGAIAAMRETSAGLRISPQIPDSIAAASYFALCWLVALGIALASPQRRLVWVAIGVPIMAALYLTGSRSGVAAALTGLVTLGSIVNWRRTAAARGIVAFALLAVAVGLLYYQSMIGRDVAGELARRSLTIRIEIFQAGLRVIATRPLLGVGIDRFYLVAGRLASPELRAMWRGRINPHNDFVRIGAELGLVGLGLFLWILVVAGRRTWVALRRTCDARLGGLAAGLVAFLVTSLASSPLSVRDVSYVFWISIGLAAGYSARLQAAGNSHNNAGPALGERSLADS